MSGAPEDDEEGLDRVVVATVAAAGRLDVVAAALAPVSRSRVAALIKAGRVSVDGRVVTRAAAAIAAGASVAVELPPPEPSEVIPEALPLRIVYQDSAVAVIDKDAGVVVHPAAGHPRGTLVNALLHHLAGLSGVGGVMRPGIVHRLDRGTSGLLVVAKHDRAHHALAAQFHDHTAGREYVALCVGVPAAATGTVRSSLGRHPTDRLRMASIPSGGKPAVTHWRRLAVTPSGLALIGCRLETGRTHQVRVHLSESGWPIAGDGTYGRKGKLPAAVAGLPNDRPLLHAWRLAFRHPDDGEERVFFAPLPEDFSEALARAGIPRDALPEPIR